MADNIVTPPSVLNGNEVRTIEEEGVHTPVMMLGDRDNPTQRQSVDNQGAAVTRFADGSPGFDIFGRLTTSELNLMGVYKFYEEDYADQFMKTETGNGTVSYDLTNRGLKLECGTTDGDVASYKSHRFYNYRPLNDMPLHFTFTSSPAIVGRTREIGWFSNGGDKMVFEEIDGVMNILVFNNLSNITTRVPQSQWNGDTLNGSGDANNLSGQTLDATKGSIWYISFQYLSMGIVEFGQVIDGVRTPLHQINHYNDLDRPYMKSASMSFGFTQTNTAICGSSGSFTVYCVTITNDGYDDFIHKQVAIDNKIASVGSDWTPIISFRPTELTGVGDNNRTRVLPRLISAFAKGSAIEIRTDKNVTLTGATWDNISKGVEFDTAATAVTVSNDSRIFGRVIGAGVSDNTNIGEIFDIAKHGVTRKHDATESDHMTISARLFDETDAVSDVGITATLWSIS